MRSWLSIFCFWVGGIALGWLVCDAAHASPLSLRAHQANLYGGKLALAKVCVTLDLKHPQLVTLLVEGQQRAEAEGDPITGDGGWNIPKMTFHLRPGRRHFCRHFDVEHRTFDDTPPEAFNVVYALLRFGTTDRAGVPRVDRSVQISPTFPALFPDDCFRRHLC